MHNIYNTTVETTTDTMYLDFLHMHFINFTLYSMIERIVLFNRRSKRLSKENLSRDQTKADYLPSIPDNLPSTTNESDEVFQDPNNLNVIYFEMAYLQITK